MMQLRNVYRFAIFVFFMLGSTQSECDSGWTNLSDGCYNYHDSAKNWDNAQKHCVDAHSARLVSNIDTDLDRLLKTYIPQSDARIWVGILTNGSGSSHWLDGTPVPNELWCSWDSSGNGNGMYQFQSGVQEYCLTTEAFGPSTKFSFICEIPPAARNSTMGKRKGNFYKQSAKRARYGSKLDSGMRGVIITCNKRERESVREAYNLLNEYADQLYGAEQKAESAEVSSDEEEEDIEAALKKEVASLKQSRPSQRRFQQVDTGTNNVVFVRTPLENPTELVRFIYEDCIASQQSKSRFILRMLPVIGTCSTHDDKISNAALELFEPLIGHGRPLTYSIHIKVRNNNGVTRTSLLPVLGRVVEELNPNASVDFNNPDVIINVDVLKTVCCFGFLTDFTKFKKYNLQEIIVANRTVNKVKKKVEEVGEDDKSGEKKDEVEETVDEGGEKNDQNEGEAEQNDQEQKMELGKTEDKVTKDAAPQVEVKGVDSDSTRVEGAVGDEHGLETEGVKVPDSTSNGADKETELGDADKPKDAPLPKEADLGKEAEAQEKPSAEAGAQSDDKSHADKAEVVETTVSSPKKDSDKSTEKDDDCPKT